MKGVGSNWRSRIALIISSGLLSTFLLGNLAAAGISLPGWDLVIGASAEESGTCGDNLTWTLDDDGVLTISGEGEMDFYYESEQPSPWLDEEESIIKVVIESGVTHIGQCAFYNCASLTEITIPDSVTSIGSMAFSNCTSLTEIAVSNDNSYYSSVDGILFNKDMTALVAYPNGKEGTTYAIPDSVTDIEYYAFFGCEYLTTVTISDSMTDIGGHAFDGFKSLTEITIPDSVTRINWNAFDNCTSLTSITIPDSVTSIGDCAFQGCTSLDNVTIPTGVPYISSFTFCDCTSLSSITIPDGVEYIDNSAFKNCSNLSEVTIPDSVRSILRYAFSNCTSLAEITIPDSVTKICEGAFENTPLLNNCAGVIYADQWAVDCDTDVVTAEILDGTKGIGEYAFYECESLTEITIPDSVTIMGQGAFKYCTSLSEITIPDGVTSIEQGTFSGCTSLTSIVIPKSVVSTAYAAFADCSSLSDVYYLGTEEEWNAVDIDSLYYDSAALNQYLYSATIHFSDGTTVKTGDLDGDDDVTLNDAFLALMAYANHAVGKDYDLTDAQFTAADVDEDGEITLNDAYVILCYYAYHAVGKEVTWKELL